MQLFDINTYDIKEDYLAESTGGMQPEMLHEQFELQEEVHEEDIIHKPTPVYPTERSYYIWYKESVPSVIDTGIISDEYELLYQSVKLNEYKSSLNMYVVSYSVCLAVIVCLLLLLPFLSKPLNNLRDGGTTISQNQNLKMPLGDNPYFNMNPFTDANTQQKPVTVEKPPVAENPVTQVTPNTETIDGMSRNSIGFMDSKNSVIYVPLPNGKYSIQESSWNNEQKALNRISTLNKLGIKNTNGVTVKAMFEKTDLVDKGVWYRTRVGEFNTIKEAKQTAEHIRSEEKLKNIASLYIFPGSSLKV
jgi:hypothetical protein